MEGLFSNVLKTRYIANNNLENDCRYKLLIIINKIIFSKGTTALSSWSEFETPEMLCQNSASCSVSLVSHHVYYVMLRHATRVNVINDLD